MRTIKKLAVAALSLSMFIIAGLSLAAPPDHANGKPPEKFYWVDVFGGPTTYEFAFVSCPAGFDTMMSVTYQGFWMVHHSKPGKEEWEFYHSATPAKIWNSDDPSIFVEGVPGQGLNRHWTGEAFNSDVIETGVQMMITLPGHGVIFRDVGRIRIDWDTFDAEFMAGHWDSWDGDFQALCDALTP